MNSIRRLIILLIMLMIMAALTCSQEPVKLNGSEGMALLKSITESPLVQANNNNLQNPANISQNQTNTSRNLTNSSQNLTNTSQNLMNSPQNPSTAGSEANSDLWSWGSRPKNPPGSQPEEDYLNESDLWAI